MNRLATVVSLGLVLLVGFVPSDGGYAATFTREAVAADHALASEAGESMLRRGGTAADAAAATMLALGVASPGSSGFGGGGFALYYRASDRTLTFLDFRETAPAATTPDLFEREEVRHPGSRASETGGLATGVPGEPAGIAELVRRFGRLSLPTIAAPAVRLARHGVALTPYVAGLGKGNVAAAMREDPLLATWFARGASALAPGRRTRNAALARTLELYARRGPSAVYGGPIGRAIVAANHARGGILTEEDLRAYRVVERAPLDERHFGYRFVTAPPESAGGATILASLDFLARAGISPGTDEASFAHALLESWKGPYLDRQRYFGDPDHVRVPLAELASPARRTARFASYRADRASPASSYRVPLEAGSPSARTPDGGGTSHLCVVDSEGNVASVTTTINLEFGARYTAAGILLNDEMDDFAKAIGAANAFGLVGGEANRAAPGKRPVSSMSPTIVFGGDGVVLCIGAAGGSRIPTAIEQVALRILVRGESAAEAIAAPRVHHQAEPDVARTERSVPTSEATLDALRARGHALELVPNVAIVTLVRRASGGRLEAASDPRKGGSPRGR